MSLVIAYKIDTRNIILKIEEAHQAYLHQENTLETYFI